MHSGGYAAGAATAVGNWETLPLVFGIMAFVYSGHGVFPSVRASMKKPEQFPKVPALRILDKQQWLVGALHSAFHACIPSADQPFYSCSARLFRAALDSGDRDPLFLEAPFQNHFRVVRRCSPCRVIVVLHGQVLDAAYLVVGSLCTFIGAAGYYMYGNAARDVITFNLPKVGLPGLAADCTCTPICYEELKRLKAC